MRIVVLTTRSRWGLAILGALVRRSIAVSAIVIDRGSLGPRDALGKFRRTLRRRGAAETARRVTRRVRRALKRLTPPIPRDRRTAGERTGAVDYRHYAPVVREVADPNAEAGVRVLTELAPDLLVLGRCRLLSPRVLRIPTVGVVNAHPGLLPAYRGVDVIPWALHHGDPLGVTIHVVDAGVDTGAVIAQRRFEVREGDTLGALTERAAAVASELLADVVERVLATGRLEGRPQDRGAGTTYTRMPARQRRAVEARLAARTGAVGGGRR